jgi:acid phosphatase (class A)
MRLPAILLSLTSVMAIAGCATAPPTRLADVPALAPGFPVGYLSLAELPDGMRLLAPPPAVGSAAEAADLERHRALDGARATSRWAVAIADDEVMSYPRAFQSFACAAGIRISEQDTPHLNMLLRRSVVDAGMATAPVKRAYQRLRPFVALNEPSCTTAYGPALAQDGSYPSGHAAAGWMWGAILAGMVPSRADALLQRGADFGSSRMVCRVHWASDVEAGRLIAAATLARLEANEQFRAQRDLARHEVQVALAKGPLQDSACSELR